MLKKAILIVILFLASLINTGCWNYIGLNEMTVVAGIAIDKIDDEYILNFEIYNLQETTTGDPIESELVETSGENIFDAVRNAKKRVSNKLYFSDAKIIIVSEKIAKEEGVESILDWFFRDPEIRETLGLVVSQEETASELLKVNGLTNNIVSSEIQNIVRKDQLVTSTTESNELYKIYNILNEEGESLTLPAIHLTNNDEDKVCEVNGVAVFKEDRLVDYLSSEETKYYLLAKGLLKGGIINISAELGDDNTEKQNIALEVKTSSSSQEYTSVEEDNLALKVSTNTSVTLGEFKDKNKKLSDDDIVSLEKQSSNIVKQNIEKVIKKIQIKYNSDILGYGKILYQKYPKKWEKVKEQISDNFNEIKISVESEVKILNTGFIK